MPGVGKTTLAIHVATRMADAYPDGLIYLDLHGHSADHESMDPATALARLLQYIGVPPARVPGGLDERAALWRTMLARRKVLILLDDASGHEQIGHLLPSGPGCLVMVTSRRRLAGLDAVRSISLDVLPPEESALLFGRVVGVEQALPSGDVATVTRLCGQLPLAIQLVGNRLRHRPAWSVADLAQKLAQRNRRLTEIRAEDRGLIAAFQLSYQELDAQQQQAFRQLGLYPGVDISPECAAALLGLRHIDAEKLLDDLLDHHLIAEPRRGRYRLHDLIGEYARLLADGDPQTTRTETLRRLFEFHLATVHAADRLLFPHHPPLVPDPAPPSVVDGLFHAQDTALAWLNTELDNLLAMIRYAAAFGWRRYSAVLPHALSRYLDTWGHWAEATDLHQAALTVWREMGDQAGEARALADLGRMRWRLDQYDQALRLASESLAIEHARHDEHAIADLLELHALVHLHRAEYDVAHGYSEQALEIRRRLGDRRGQGASLTQIAATYWSRGNYPETARRLRGALAIYQEEGDRRGQQATLNNIADTELQLGHHDVALRHFEQAGAMGPHLGAPSEAIWLNNIANAYRHLDRQPEALDHYRKALILFRRMGDRRNEAEALNDIGCCFSRMGRDSEALIHHQKALNIAMEISARDLESRALRHIGTIHHRAQRYETALHQYRSTLDLARQIGDVYQEACALREIGSTMSSTGDLVQATAYWRQALDLFEHLGMPDAEALRKWLSGKDEAAGS
jgi:tetratricopeptide (TPR) repeat protein